MYDGMIYSGRECLSWEKMVCHGTLGDNGLFWKIMVCPERECFVITENAFLGTEWFVLGS